MLNKVTIMGRITKDLELKKTSTSGHSVVSFSIANDRNYKENGEYPTDFYDIVAWRTTAEFICNHFSKGMPILIDGRLQPRDYTDNNGVKRRVVEIIVDNAHFCGDKKATQNGGHNGNQRGNNGNQGGGNNGGGYNGNHGQNGNYNHAPQDNEFNGAPPDDFNPYD